jgi:serine/threonine-protein kinase HipA
VGQLRVGELSETANGLLSLTYDADWLSRPEGYALSPHLPLRPAPHVGKPVAVFFGNLLPEGEHLNWFLEKACKISRDDIYMRIARFGGDVAGGLSILPSDLQPDDAPRYRQLSFIDEAKELLSKWMGVPVRMADVRVSLPGAQCKLPVYVNTQGEMSLPLIDAPSTHILKPSVTKFANSAINETLVSNLAKAVGLNVPEVHFIPELDACLIARYDRYRDVSIHARDRATTAFGRGYASPKRYYPPKGGGFQPELVFVENGPVRRLHQIDFCQMLYVDAGRKYESQGGPNLPQCFECVMRHSDAPEEDRARLAEWVIFNMAVGNMDSHAKNLSMLLQTDGKVRLAPFYDLLCTTVYPELDNRFVFSFADEFRPSWITDKDWDDLCQTVGLDADEYRLVRERTLSAVAENLPDTAERLRALPLTSEQSSMIDVIAKNIQQQIDLINDQSVSPR